MATDSAWSNGTITLSDPASTGTGPSYTDSAWSSGTITLADPAPPANPYSDSPWSSGTIRLRSPHKPYAVWDATANQLKWISQRVWDGTTLR